MKKYYTESRRGNCHTIKYNKANWIGHCLLKHIIEGKVEERIEMVRR
jgi:hypothetical protein